MKGYRPNKRLNSTVIKDKLDANSSKFTKVSLAPREKRLRSVALRVAKKRGSVAKKYKEKLIFVKKLISSTMFKDPVKFFEELNKYKQKTIDDYYKKTIPSDIMLKDKDKRSVYYNKLNRFIIGFEEAIFREINNTIKSLIRKLNRRYRFINRKIGTKERGGISLLLDIAQKVGLKFDLAEFDKTLRSAYSNPFWLYFERPRNFVDLEKKTISFVKNYKLLTNDSKSNTQHATTKGTSYGVYNRNTGLINVNPFRTKDVTLTIYHELIHKLLLDNHETYLSADKQSSINGKTFNIYLDLIEGNNLRVRKKDFNLKAFEFIDEAITEFIANLVNMHVTGEQKHKVMRFLVKKGEIELYNPYTLGAYLAEELSTKMSKKRIRELLARTLKEGALSFYTVMNPKISNQALEKHLKEIL